MKRFKIFNILYTIILIFIHLELVQSFCFIKYPNNTEISPIYKKIFGKYSVELPYNSKGIQLNNGEQIEAICRTNFTSVSYNIIERDRYGYNRDRVEYLTNQTSIRLECRNNQIYFNNFILKEKILECMPLKWSIYDANLTYEWCEKNENSKTFLLAVKSNDDHHILAGICYNLNKWSLQTITYNVTNSEQKHNIEMLRDIKKTELKAYQSLGDDLFNLKTTTTFDLTDQELQQQLNELSKTNSWLHLATYELSSIVQGNSYENYFNEYINILNTIWWRNLRLGNWKHFMETLENYASNNSFQVYTGTSGIVEIPAQNIKTHYTLEIKNGFQNETIPSYIWSYITSTDKQNKDFIIVGYNSPYAEFFNLEKVVFCPNICSEIPWLKDIHSSFRFVTAGIMFCCSPEFMHQTNYLHGFPTDILEDRIKESQANIAELNENSTLPNVTSEIDRNLQTEIEIKTESSLAGK